MSDWPGQATTPTKQGFWQSLWGMPLVLRVVLALVLVAVIVAVVVGVLNGGGSSSGITTDQYQQWRAECEARATATLDTSLYQVGGNHWVDEVNKCLVAKASD